MKVRTFKPEDWKIFEPIEKKLFPDHTMNKADFLEALEHGHFVGAFHGEELIGYLKLGITGATGHLGRIGVIPTKREKGFGSELMEYALQFYHRQAVKKIRLFVETENEPAINLYEKYGFHKKEEAWHYKLSKEDISEIEDMTEIDPRFTLRKVSRDEYSVLSPVFPRLRETAFQKHVDRENTLPLTLFKRASPVIYAAFNPDFSGARPLLCNHIRDIDQFLVRLQNYRQSEKPYYRFTFSANEELANYFAARGYQLWDHMWEMEKTLR